MNANFKIFLSGLIIIVVAYFLIRRRKILEGFATKTASGKECIPWKNAVQFREYGDSKTCRNPESDVNGSWCYTDTFGNYEYCNSYTPGCMNMKILEGCFNPDKDGYQIVIYNSQPFNEDYLELDKIVDSTNQIWCLDKSGRLLRTTKKEKYVNYEWTDMINDSFNNYNPNSERFYLISGFGVKKGGYIDTQKNNREEDVRSLMASEVCYIILRNYFNRRENKLMRCILSEQMNIQSDDPNYYINMGWRTSEREYIELADKISIDKNGYIFGIHREKIKEGKGLTWGDMVIGREDENGQILFSLLGETFPKDVSKITNYEYSDIEDSDENLGSRRFIVNTSKKLFNNKILKFVHKSSYIINDLLNKKDSRLITNFMNEIAGKTELQGDDAENVEQFNRYLRNRILLNKDFRFKEVDKDFTYTLSPEFLQRNGRVIDYANPVSGDSANNGIPINPVFNSEDMLGIMNEFEVIKHLNNVEKFTNTIQQIKPELVFTEEYENFNKIKKIDSDIEKLGLVMNVEQTGEDNSVFTFNENFVINNIRSEFRNHQSFTPTRNVIDELRGILNGIKDIEMSGSNLDLKNRLQSVVTSFDNNIGNLKQEFDNSDIKNKYNLVLDKILEIQEKFDTTRTTEASKQSYFDNEFGEDQNVNHKKIYYKIIYLMMDYFISRTSFLYDSISRSVTKLNEHFSDTDSIVDALKTGNCNLRDNNYEPDDADTRGLWPTYYEEKIQEKIRTEKRDFGDRMKGILEEIKNLLRPNNRQSKDNIINHLEESRDKLERIVNLRGDLSELSGNHGIKTCEYEYFPDISPSVSHERNEYNCFQDFVTRQIVDLREIKQRMELIYTEGKAKEVEVNLESENTRDVSSNNQLRNERLQRKRQATYRFHRERVTANLIRVNTPEYFRRYPHGYFWYSRNPRIFRSSRIGSYLGYWQSRWTYWNRNVNPILDIISFTYDRPGARKVLKGVRIQGAYNNSQPPGRDIRLTYFYNGHWRRWADIRYGRNGNEIQEFVNLPEIQATKVRFEIRSGGGLRAIRADLIYKQYTKEHVGVLPNGKFVDEEGYYLNSNMINQGQSLRTRGIKILPKNPVVELSDTDYVHPEIAEFLGESEIILENIARKEALLRYNTNFFYMLDELLEGEGDNFSTPDSYDTLSGDQKNIIIKMFKLFFDRVTNDDDMMETEAPIESPHDNYEMLSPSPSYEPKNLYNEEFLEQLYPRELLVESDYEQFETELNAPGASPAETLDANCDTKLSSKRFINKLNLRRKILNDVLINYKRKRGQFDNLNFDNLNTGPSMTNFNFVNNLETACRAAKDILFDRLLVNYVRDDVQLFPSGDVNVAQIYSNFFNDLKEVEEETELNFDLTIMEQQRGVLFDSIINKYEDIYNRFRIVTNQTSASTDITNYLQSKDITIENVAVSINNSLSQTYQRLVTNPRQNQNYPDEKEYTTKFNIIQSHHTELLDFYQKLKESLMTIFPNRNILTYIKYLNDYDKTRDLDIIRKIEILKETQKIMGEISNLVVHQGIDMGVIDFNLTEKYLYIDYLAPSASAQNDRSLVAYDWSDTSTENLIKSFSIITVRLNKDYIDHVFESRYTDLRYLRYLDENDIIKEIIPNDNESQFQQSITLSTSKVVTMFEKDEEGRPKKLLRSEHNIGREILQNYNNEFVNIYKDKLNDNNNENYEVLMRAMLNMELVDEINKYKFVEQGKMFIKQNVNVDNKLHVYLKEYDSSKTARQQVLEYNEHVNNSVGRNEIPTKTNKVRYFHDFSDKEDHPNLMEEGTRGNQNDRMIYKIIPGSLTGSTSGYGIMRYNYTNSLNLGSDREKELLSNVYFKRNVFFQIYGKEDRGTDAGPIELVNKTELNYILTPEIKYIHGLEYKEDGKIKRSDYYGLLYWFYLRQKEGKFVNVKQWYDYYKTLKMEGMYNIAADPQKFKLNTSFSNQFEEYVKSLESKPDIGKLDEETTKILLELANFSYDKELKIEPQFPQIKLHRLKTKKYSNQVFVEVKRFNPNDDSEFNDIDRDILTMVADIDPNTERNLRTTNTSFLDKYSSHIQDMKNNESFDYKYFKLVKQNKFDLLSDSDFCENSEKMNKYESLFRYKIIQNFSDYKNLVEDNEFGEDRDEATNRVKGLYDLNNIYKDEMYYQLIKRKRDSTKDLTVKETCKKILEDKKKNMLMGTGYPFMVIYQVRDYQGFPCQEGIKNSQRIFLTFNLKPNFIMDDITSSNNDLIDKKEGPLLSEEFLAYTGQGASIRFAFQKVKGNTPLKTKDVCPSAPYDPLPGYSDDCGTDGGCGNLSVGMTRLDGTPKCSLGDPEVKTTSVTPLDVSILGNVPKDACDIYKVKGNKRVKYTLGKMFGYNDAGKYQLKNQYTLKYGDYYFYYQKKANKIIFKDEFLTDPEEVSKYAFNITYGEDNYGVYILLSPYLGPRGDNAKYLTRVINIFDKHFDGWALEKKMDKIDDKKKSYIRDKETGEKKIYGDSDLDFYAQKFNLPDDLVLKITSEEGIKSKLLDEMKSDLEKGNFLFCNVGGQGESEICKGDFNSRPTMTLDEENEILRKQATQIESLMRRFDNVPSTHFTRLPQNEQLLNYINSTINTIKQASTFVYERVKDVNWVVKTQLESNAQVQNQVETQTTEKISNNKLMDQPMGDLVDEQGIMADALKSMKDMNVETTTTTRQCKSIEGFTGGAPSLSPERKARFNRNISGRYYTYIKDEIEKKKQNITNLNEKIHAILTNLNQMSDGMDLSGEKKQMLLSELVQERNKLEKMMFDIKNYEQQDRITRIGNKLNEVEELREEMEEDNFMIKKPADDANNVSIISREDGEFLNMYRINDKNTPDHLLFINGGCLEYEPKKRDIKVSHCMANSVNQQFNIYRVEDKTDMNNYNLKNADKGLDRAFDIVRTKDGKCLHKENGELSFRRCDNTKNQYWDYSNVTGPCKM